MNQESQEKSISELVFADMWANLNTNQRRYAIAMLESQTMKEAAELAGVKPNTAYKWGEEVTAVVEFMRANIEASAMGIIYNAANKAAAVKQGGLDSDNEKIRQDVATEILDRIMGKPTQRSEVTGAAGGPVEFSITEWHKNYEQRRQQIEDTAKMLDDDTSS